jgi:hypothetical protein
VQGPELKPSAAKEKTKPTEKTDLSHLPGKGLWKVLDLLKGNMGEGRKM